MPADCLPTEGFGFSRPRKQAASWRVRALLAAMTLLLAGSFATIEALARV